MTIEPQNVDAAPETGRCFPETLAKWADLIAKLGAIFVVCFGVYEYLDGKDALRIGRTQDLMKEYSAGPVGEARRLISQTLQLYLPVIDKLRATPMSSEGAAAAHADLVHFLVRESRDAKGLAAEVDTVIEFYERLLICVERRLCDADIARAYFQSDVRWTFSNFRPYIIERRKNSSNYAVAAERLSSL